MSKKSISGFTTTYNCFEMHYPLMECVKSLLGFCDEISIVDAGSTDGTIEAIKKLQAQESRIKFSVEPVDFTHPRWAIYQDGYLKAKARDKCTADYCWQTDTDEIVAEHDFEKIRNLPSIVGITPLIMLPMIEFWGSLKTIRADFFSWKPRFSINDKRITHGIPKELRCYDSEGHEYPRPFDSDSCNYIYRDSLASVPIVIPIDTQSIKNVSLGTKEYENLFYNWLEIYPAVFHVSWLDLRRKVQHYKKLWRRFHASMYNLKLEDTSENNVMFDMPWSEVSERDIKEKAQELICLGPRFFHKKMDHHKNNYVIEFNKESPKELIAWHKKELENYDISDKALIDASLNSSPLVSAVIPAMHTVFLKEAVECLIKQNYSNLEILVVNEGNTDEIAFEIEKLQKQYPLREITLINKKQSSIADAKNYGVRQARGTYVMLLEAEDLIMPDYISKSVSILNSNKVNLVFSNVEIAGEKSGEWTPQVYDEYALRNNNTIPKSAIFSRALWNRSGGFCSSMPFCENWDFWIKCTQNGLKPAHINEKLIIDRVYPEYDTDLHVNNAQEIQKSLISIANQELYPVDEVLNAQSLLIKLHDQWIWRCESLERSKLKDWFLRFLSALGFEGRGQTQDAMNNYGASIELSNYKNWQPLYRLAIILEGINKRKEALEFYNSVRLLRPDMNKVMNLK